MMVIVKQGSHSDCLGRLPYIHHIILASLAASVYLLLMILRESILT